MRQVRGFTLLEVMVAIVIVAILTSIAFPSYTDYITRATFAEAQSNLADLRVKMEQYYMDNRRYSATTGGGTCGVTGGNTPTVPNARYFTYSCASGTNTATGDQSYVLTATGVAAQGTDGILFTINQDQTRSTTVNASTAMADKGYASNAGCWVRKKPSQC